MKKIILIIVCLFINIEVNAEEIKVKFSKCVDGDTAKFIYKNEEITARFLAIDTPETVHPTIGEEPFGKEASEYTCNELKNAEEIVLEFDKNSDKQDKYDRYLVWVFVDGNLLQKKLINKGYAEVAYLYDDYKYTSELEKQQEKAKEKKIGIWSLNEENISDALTSNDSTERTMTTIYHQEYNMPLIITALVLIILICIFSESGRNKIFKSIKKNIKKELKK